MIRRKRRKKSPVRYIDDVQIYKREDRETGEPIEVAYFDIWVKNQIGAPWNDQFNFMLDTMRMGLEEVQEYWRKLRNDFYAWCRKNNIRAMGVHMYDDSERGFY